jgi:gliding motility-associated-like protein
MEVEDAFRPNGDGRNEDFLPKELTIADVDFIFTVTDKTGQVVFQTKDKYQPWNGEFNNNGSALPAGLYFWKLSFTDDKGAIHEQKGKINLLR